MRLSLGLQWGLWLVGLLPGLRLDGFLLVPGWMQLPPEHCSVGWFLDKGPHMSSQMVSLLPGKLPASRSLGGLLLNH